MLQFLTMSIPQVFSEDQSGDMTFSDFLDMLSVMSMQAPKDLKAAYAFKVRSLIPSLYYKLVGLWVYTEYLKYERSSPLHGNIVIFVL